MLCFYRGLLILYFVLYLYFVFLLLPTWCIKPDDEVDDDDDDDDDDYDDDDDNRFDTPSALRCSDAQTDRQTDKMIYQYRALSILTRNIKL